MKKNCKVVLDTPKTTKTIQIHQRNKEDLSFGNKWGNFKWFVSSTKCS